VGDDWKGEGLIRKSVTKKESTGEVRRLVSKIYHKNRRENGIPVPAAKTHGAMMRAILYDVKKDK
jgi:hypothetical protein